MVGQIILSVDCADKGLDKTIYMMGEYLNPGRNPDAPTPFRLY